MEELLKQLLEAELARVQDQAKKAAEPPAAPAEPDKSAAPELDLAKLAEALAPAIDRVVEEKVQKALPAPRRGEGSGGPKGTVETPANVLEALVAKAQKPSDLSIAEKRLVWGLTERVLRQGLVAGPDDDN